MVKGSKKNTNEKKNILNKVKFPLGDFFKILGIYFDKFVDKIYSLDPKANTRQRVLSSIVLIPVAIYAILYSSDLFIILAIASAVIMTWEWINITKDADDQRKWQILGFFYIVVPVYAIIRIRLIDTNILLWMFAVIWATDILAFFAGRILQGPKLAPTISPNKTWSGLFGGVVAAIMIGFLSSFMFPPGGMVFFVVASAILSVIEQISDLLESKIKRIFKVKDSGNIIPGHGGLLDRLDGMILVAPIVLFLITVFSDKF